MKMTTGKKVSVAGFGQGVVTGFIYIDQRDAQRDTYEQPEGPHSVKVSFTGKDGTPHAGGFNTFAPDEVTPN